MNKCIVCEKDKGRNKLFCSKTCQSDFRANKKVCIICGIVFKASKSSMTKCCSDTCSAENRRNMHQSGIYDYANDKFAQGRIKSLDKYQGEKHFGAKQWVIESSSGVVYKCTNLMHFIKNNPDLFDGTVKQSFDGFAKIKSSMNGKRKNPCYTWKGWKLLSWNDNRLDK